MDTRSGFEIDYVTRVFDSPQGVGASAWDALLAAQSQPTPFMRHAYLAALHDSGSAVPDTGWSPRWVTLWQGNTLAAGCVLYLKPHSYGEYVFDWAWAQAYEQHGLSYYPKAVVAVPFTPVPGSRLLARDAAARQALVRALIALCQDEHLSSLHLLFGADDDLQACAAQGLMQRHTVQFHWRNARPADGAPYADMDDFLASLSQDKRKKIRQERRKVAEAGVRVQVIAGEAMRETDWALVWRCYQRTYLEHGNAPYLTPDFFDRMARNMAQHWAVVVALRRHGGQEQPIAMSLLALGHDADGARVAYGRYWGALERVDCLHFELCYHAPIEWCIAQGIRRFEGGAQGEHKMARALMPVRTSSAHWLAHPAFADAVERFLDREGRGVQAYLDHLDERSPFRRTGT